MAPLLILLLALASRFQALGQGTAFTYQGRLNEGANLANGSYDLRFAIYDAASAGAPQGNLLTNTATAVSNGLFTVTLDFGNQFPGAARWLEIAVGTNNQSGFTVLSPRQVLTPVPYAITAANAANLAKGAALGSGANNSILGAAEYAFLAGGFGNYVGNSFSGIMGGIYNTNTGPWCFLGGGSQNNSFGFYNVLCGGELNITSADYSTVGGGHGNSAMGSSSTVPGGHSNTASGDRSFAAGYKAQALHSGTFVWADSQGTSFASTSPNQFLIRAAGGVGLGTTNPAAQLHVSGVGETFVVGGDPHAGGFTALSVGTSAASGGYAWLQGIKDSGTNYGNLVFNPNAGNVGIGTSSPGTLLQVGSATCNGTVWLNSSDRALKQNFRPVNSRELLEKIAALPITEWDYRQDAGAKHLGPMAQDFHAAFGLNGADDKHISTVDEAGVALAAIQGLNRKLETENAELKARLEKLERLVASLAGQK